MHTDIILTDVAILFLAAVVWDDLRQGGRVTIKRQTWLMVAALLTVTSLVLQVVVH